MLRHKTDWQFNKSFSSSFSPEELRLKLSGFGSNGSETYLPFSSIQQWYTNFQRRLIQNPYFWRNWPDRCRIIISGDHRHSLSKIIVSELTHSFRNPYFWRNWRIFCVKTSWKSKKQFRRYKNVATFDVRCCVDSQKNVFQWIYNLIFFVRIEIFPRPVNIQLFVSLSYL